MSIFDNIKDIAKIGFDPLGIFTETSSRKKERHLMNQQIKDYNEQSKLAKDELARVKDEQATEKRRIQEKQIRALRGRSSSRGLLGSSNEMNLMNLSNQLGG